MNKKAQHILFGSLFAFFIFFLIFSVFYDYTFINTALTGKSQVVLTKEAARVAVTLTQYGYPQDWTTANVERLGIGEDGLLNVTKTTQLQTIAEALGGYEHIKQLLGINNNYLITITDNDELAVAIGEESVIDELTLLATNPALLATQERILIHPESKKPVILTVYIYQ